MGRPVIADTTTATVQSGTQITLPDPAGVQVGDLLVAVLTHSGAGVTVDFAGTGWSRVAPPFENPSTSAHRVLGFYVHVVTSTSPSSYGLTFTTAGTGRLAGTLHRITGADTATVPASLTGYGTDAAGPPSTVVIPTMTPPGVESLSLVALNAQYTAPSFPTITQSATNGYTSTAHVESTSLDGGGRTVLVVFTRNVDPGDSTGTTVSIGTSVQRAGAGIILAGTPAPATVNPPPATTTTIASAPTV
jgi:hypothetical protein